MKKIVFLVACLFVGDLFGGIVFAREGAACTDDSGCGFGEICVKKTTISNGKCIKGTR